jgi:hypothetical protein
MMKMINLTEININSEEVLMDYLRSNIPKAVQEIAAFHLKLSKKTKNFTNHPATISKQNRYQFLSILASYVVAMDKDQPFNSQTNQLIREMTEYLTGDTK